MCDLIRRSRSHRARVFPPHDNGIIRRYVCESAGGCGGIESFRIPHLGIASRSLFGFEHQPFQTHLDSSSPPHNSHYTPNSHIGGYPYGAISPASVPRGHVTTVPVSLMSYERTRSREKTRLAEGHDPRWCHTRYLSAPTHPSPHPEIETHQTSYLQPTLPVKVAGDVADTNRLYGDREEGEQRGRW